MFLYNPRRIGALIICLLLFAITGAAFAAQWAYQAETALSHQIGRLDGDGWSASIAQDSQGYLCNGPGTTEINGPNCATYRMMIDYRSAATGKVARLEVYDDTTGLAISSREIRRNEFITNYTYQNFNLLFNSTNGHPLEFRVYWYDSAYIKVDSVVITAQSSVTLDDYWEGRAKWTQVATEIPMQVDRPGYQMVFPSMSIQGDEIWAYYMANEQYQCYEPNLGQSSHQIVGRARSYDAIHWIDDGVVLHVGGYPSWTYQAQNQLYHQVGRADGDGWSANTTQDSAGYLCYGPYTTSILSGPMEADYVLRIDNNTLDSNVVVSLDVYDATAGKVLASRSIGRKEFQSTSQDNYFHLNFTSPGNSHALEFRTYWHDIADIRQQYVAIAEGSFPHIDGFYAAYAGAFKDSGTWYLVYETCQYNLSDTSKYALGSAYTPPSGSWGCPPQVIGLATSTDGLNFHRSANNPILTNYSTGWERDNIGTPTLDKKINGDWLLYYHGYGSSGQGGPDDCQIGWASGPSLFNLTKNSANPVIPTVAGSAWESGTTGRRSTIIQAPSGRYYMAYEGSSDAVGELGFNAASWSSGLARSSDKLSWTKYPGNPILPIVPENPGVTIFQGNSAPEMLVFNGATFLYVMADFNHEAVYRLDSLDDTTAPTVPGTPTDTGAYTTDTSLTFNWTASSDSGMGILAYNCQIGTTPGASDVLNGYMGNVLSATITGNADKTYYCRVQAVDVAGNVSEWSASSDGITIVENTGISIGVAKGLARPVSVGFASKPISAVFSDYFYIQEPDRSAGIMVRPVCGLPAGIAVGMLADVGGIIRENSDHELYIDAAVSLQP